MIHVRLKNELERIGLKAAAAAKAIGESDSQGLRDVLGGRKRLSADLLAALKGVGVNVLYVLTGEPAATSEAPTPSLPDLGIIELAVEYVRDREQLEKRKLTAAQFAKAVRLTYQITLEEQTAGVSPGGEKTESSHEPRARKRTKTT